MLVNEATALTKSPNYSGDDARGAASSSSFSSRSRSILMKKIFLSSITLAIITVTLWVTSDRNDIYFQPRSREVSSSQLKQEEVVPLLGKSKKKSKNKKNYPVLQMASEASFHFLFQDDKGVEKYEASGLFKVKNDYYVIFDNDWAIAKVSAPFTSFSNENKLIEWNKNIETEDDSEYEAIFYQNNSFYAVQESIPIRTYGHKKKKRYHAIIKEIQFDISSGDDTYDVFNECRSEFEFDGDSKGFEGAVGFPSNNNGTLYILGLCEGNFCKENKRHDTGHGRIVVMAKNDNDENKECVWKTIKIIDVPSSADFSDYSDLDITPNGKVVISSQENSSLWIGMINGIQDGMLDPSSLEFDNDDGQVYLFPGTSDVDEESPCIYCNIEGVSFVDNYGGGKQSMIMAVSDKSKKKQKHWSIDESIHLFVVPDGK